MFTFLYTPDFFRKLQIHRQKVASEQQKITKRHAPQAPTSPSLSPSSQSAAEAVMEAGMGLCFALLLKSCFDFVSIFWQVKYPILIIRNFPLREL